MSRNAVAAFLRDAVQNDELRHALVEWAGRQGFVFSADDLGDADLDGVVGGALTVGKPRDRGEREADAEADGVIR